MKGILRILRQKEEHHERKKRGWEEERDIRNKGGWDKERDKSNTVWSINGLTQKVIEIFQFCKKSLISNGLVFFDDRYPGLF